jgi:hypothetical protein
MDGKSGSSTPFFQATRLIGQSPWIILVIIVAMFLLAYVRRMSHVARDQNPRRDSLKQLARWQT